MLLSNISGEVFIRNAFNTVLDWQKSYSWSSEKERKKREKVDLNSTKNDHRGCVCNRPQKPAACPGKDLHLKQSESQEYYKLNKSLVRQTGSLLRNTSEGMHDTWEKRSGGHKDRRGFDKEREWLRSDESGISPGCDLENTSGVVS